MTKQKDWDARGLVGYFLRCDEDDIGMDMLYDELAFRLSRGKIRV